MRFTSNMAQTLTIVQVTDGIKRRHQNDHLRFKFFSLVESRKSQLVLFFKPHDRAKRLPLIPDRQCSVFEQYGR